MARDPTRADEIEGEVSRAVREQYEENPYPRWIKAARRSSTRCLPAASPDKFPTC